MTQAVIGTSTARISTYVDDPIIVAVGPKADRDVTFGVTLSLWSALGLPLSLSKAVRGEKVTWTSASSRAQYTSSWTAAVSGVPLQPHVLEAATVVLDAATTFLCVR